MHMLPVWKRLAGGSPPRELLAGALGGLIGTAPMSATIVLLKRLLPRRERYVFPPHGGIQHVAEARAGRPDLAGTALDTVGTVASHLGYGAATGSLFLPLTRRLPLPAVPRGLLFGLGVWAASYFGLLPALRLYPSPLGQPPRRTAVVVIAHLVWGVAVALVAGRAGRRPTER